MPLNEKGTKIKSAMEEQYGPEKGERVFYASKNKGTITGVDSKTTVTHSQSIPGLGRTTVSHTNDYGTSEGARKRAQGSHPRAAAGSPRSGQFTLPAKTMPGTNKFTGYSEEGGARPPRHPAPKAEYKGYGDKAVRDAGENGGIPAGSSPRPHKDLLGEVSTPESTPRGPLKQAAAPERTKESKDAKKSEDQSSTAPAASVGAPMNNLGMGIPSPTITSTPGTSTPSSTTTGDSLRTMNQNNRAFWASRKR